MASYVVIQNSYRKALRRERIFRDRSQVLDTLDDVDIFSRYRMDRQNILQLANDLGPIISPPTFRSHSIPAHLQLLIALRYFAKGGFLSEIGDIHGVSRSSVSRIITSVTDAIVQTKAEVISFPRSAAALRSIKESFYNIANFPNVVGAIDGTLIPILSPSRDENIYVCRKGFHAINVQGVVDAKLRFTNIVAKWPGSVHDSFIWSNSCICQKFQDGEIDGWLLGDSGYPLRPWILTPVLHPCNNGQQNYNSSHIKTRNVVERTFGLCKSRFRCLHKSTGCLMSDPNKCCRIIYAVCVLHNICINKIIPLPDVDEDGNIEDEMLDPQHIYTGHHDDGQTTRNNLIANRFT